MEKLEIKTKFKKTKYLRVKGGSRILQSNGTNVHGDYVIGMLFDDTLSFTKRDFEVKQDYIEEKGFNPDTLERQTCGRRGEIGSRNPNAEGIDYWENDRHGSLDGCSYCGSAKFEVFMEVVDAINAGKEGYSIEKASGKNYKYYIGSPQSSHMKFYTPHIPKEIMEDESKRKELNDKLIPACKKSWDEFIERTKNQHKPK